MYKISYAAFINPSTFQTLAEAVTHVQTTYGDNCVLKPRENGMVVVTTKRGASLCVITRQNAKSAEENAETK